MAAIRYNDINLLYRFRENPEKEYARKRAIYMALPAVAAVTAMAVFFAVNTVQVRTLENDIAIVESYIYDQTNIDLVTRADELNIKMGELSAKTGEIEAVDIALSTFPKVSESTYQVLASCAEEGVTITMNGYSEGSGILAFSAVSKSFMDIPAFIRRLEASGILAEVSYTGYGYSESEELYTVNVNAVIKSPLIIDTESTAAEADDGEAGDTKSADTAMTEGEQP